MPLVSFTIGPDSDHVIDANLSWWGREKFYADGELVLRKWSFLGGKPREFRFGQHLVSIVLSLARTVAILSGMCTGLDPNFNLWNQISPYARKLIEQEATKGLGDWLEEFGKLLQNLIALPSQASRFFAQAERGDLIVQAPQVSREVRLLPRSVDRLTGGVIFFGFLLAGVILYNAGNVASAQALFGAAVATLLWVLFARRE